MSPTAWLPKHTTTEQSAVAFLRQWQTEGVGCLQVAMTLSPSLRCTHFCDSILTSLVLKFLEVYLL